MKILYVCTHPHINIAEHSGPGTHVREVIEALRNEGQEVSIYAAGGDQIGTNLPQASNRAKSSLRKWIPRFIWESLKEFQLLRHNRRMIAVLQEVIQREQPDMVYERAYYLQTACSILCHRMGIKHIIEINAPYPEEKKAMQGAGCFHFLSKRSERQQVELSSKVIVVSSALKNYLQKKNQVDATKIEVIPNAVRHDFGKNRNALSVQSKWNIREGDFVIGFVGSIFPYHGVDRLIAAFASLQNHTQWPKLKLLIVGNGEILPQLKNMSDSLGLSDRVVFTDKVPHDEVASYIECMHVAVMPHSNWYGSPVKIFEYAALKKMVIAPNNVPVRDVMVDGEDGLLISDDQEELNQALRKTLDAESAVHTMALNFHTKVMASYTWQRVGQKILHL
ncbi:MAG: glycosyltransferase family 4 protein [Flavobacteriales bacterium]